VFVRRPCRPYSDQCSFKIRLAVLEKIGLNTSFESDRFKLLFDSEDCRKVLLKKVHLNCTNYRRLCAMKAQPLYAKITLNSWLPPHSTRVEDETPHEVPYEIIEEGLIIDLN